jgi:hypothetical protein
VQARRSSSILAATVVAVLLAACGQAVAVPDETPEIPASEAPRPTPRPTAQPTVRPTRAPSEEPSIAPTAPPAAPSRPASPPTVGKLPIWSVARTTAAGVAVRTLPSVDAPMFTGERRGDFEPVPNLRLPAGQHVVVTLGPVSSDGHDWYLVDYDDSDADVYFPNAWVSGSFLEPASEPIGTNPNEVVLTGANEEASVSFTVGPWSYATARFAAAPIGDAPSCEFHFEMAVDGVPVMEADQHVTTGLSELTTPRDVPDLVGDEDAEITLTARTDCSFAVAGYEPQG